MGTEASQENSHYQPIWESMDMVLWPSFARKKRKWINLFSNSYHLGSNQELLCEFFDSYGLSPHKMFTLHSISGSLQKPWCPFLGPVSKISLHRLFLSLQCCILYLKKESTHELLFIEWLLHAKAYCAESCMESIRKDIL